MIRHTLIVVEVFIAVLLVFIYSDIKKTSTSSHPVETYTIACVDNINYVIFNNRIASVKYDTDGDIETCDLGEQ